MEIDNPLGKKTSYYPYYNPGVLFPISREVNRREADINEKSFVGYDLWNGYEFSWLSPSGKPEVRRIRIVYPADSKYMVESKSLKLYLGSFVMTVFEKESAVVNTICKDLAAVLQIPHLEVTLFPFNSPVSYAVMPKGILLDELECECRKYEVDSSLLQAESVPSTVEEMFYSNLLKTNCPITGQPDWATVFLFYRGQLKIDRKSLLQYFVSYREHGDYHEACCECIFCDLFRLLKPEQLIVKCFFTRRGGIDINPCRFFGVGTDKEYDLHFWRQ